MKNGFNAKLKNESALKIDVDGHLFKAFFNFLHVLSRSLLGLQPSARTHASLEATRRDRLRVVSQKSADTIRTIMDELHRGGSMRSETRLNLLNHAFVAKFEEIGERLPGIVFVAAFALILAAAIAVDRGGFIHIECEQYIPHYLAKRPILEKIFDFNKVEIIRVFRPRPLSYLVDDLDVNFIGWSCAKGYAHFESASYFVFWILNSLLLWYSFRTLFRLDRMNSALLVGLLSTSPVIFFNTHYFRSAKPGAVFFMFCGFIMLWGVFLQALDGKRPIARAGFAFLLLAAACLFDEIPPAFCLAAILMLALERQLNGNTRMREAIRLCVTPIAAALIVFLIYDVWIHKRLVAYFVGQDAPLDFQASFVEALLTNTVNAIVGSVSVFTESFGYIIGSLSSAFAGAVFILLLLVWRRSSGRNAMVRILAGGVLMFGILFGMVSRAHFIFHFEARRMLYPYPLSFVFIMFLGLSAAQLLNSRLVSRGALHAIIFLLILSNLTSLPTHWRILQEDGERAAYSRAMVLALRSPEGITVKMLQDADLGRFYAMVSKSPIYASLKR